MTTYKFFLDKIEMVNIDSTGYFSTDSDVDLLYILTCLRADIYVLTIDAPLQCSGRYTTVYNLLDDIIKMCHTSIIGNQYIFRLVCHTLEIMPRRSYKNFRFTFKY